MPSSKKYTQAEVDFATEVANKTGADFYTIFGWEIAEGGPADNPLNIGPGNHYGTPVKAADVTSQMIEKSNYYTDILKSFQTKYPTEDKAIAEQSKAIAYNEHWNVISPKTNTPAEIIAKRKQYLSNIEGGALTALYEKVQPNSNIDTQGNIQNPADPNPFGGGILGGVTGAIGDAAHAIAAPFEFVQSHWKRILFVIAGAIVIIIALVFVGLSVKKNTMSFERGDG